MGAIVVDTHAIVWYLVEPDRLSQPASDAFDQAAATGAAIYVSAISLVEIVYLVEKWRLPQAVLDRLTEDCPHPRRKFRSLP